MRIGELARLAGVSARALRHYEDRGLLVPGRTGGGYREYADTDVARVAQITAMISAGLNTATVGRYLGCARTGEHGTSLELCPGLSAELVAIGERLEARLAELRDQQARLRELASAD
ncbi:DNA-binding transcriptional regulator, MerR family [Krasilnikoviella flava]|uniref:DNA-binding transcriptional regulator, MerR family n=1 Tax=Krasilnikoviella flava TaxID=526729 RepID=A0A1T5M353_9MICO|nr:MerR family transcriptional regulator [Krasilnikoviella flava]SKC82593.1 DNA-binding transcriptional regulator, MerR family [Krasilnikoviella flava]